MDMNTFFKAAVCGLTVAVVGASTGFSSSKDGVWFFPDASKQDKEIVEERFREFYNQIQANTEKEDKFKKVCEALARSEEEEEEAREICVMMKDCMSFAVKSKSFKEFFSQCLQYEFSHPGFISQVGFLMLFLGD